MFVVTTVRSLGWVWISVFYISVDISLAVLLNPFPFQLVDLLSFSWPTFSAGGGLWGGRLTARV